MAGDDENRGWNLHQVRNIGNLLGVENGGIIMLSIQDQAIKKYIDNGENVTVSEVARNFKITHSEVRKTLSRLRIHKKSQPIDFNKIFGELLKPRKK